MSKEYEGRRFDLSEGGIYVSNPPKDWGLALCYICEAIFETPVEDDFDTKKHVCNVCKSNDKRFDGK